MKGGVVLTPFKQLARVAGAGGGGASGGDWLSALSLKSDLMSPADPVSSARPARPLPCMKGI